MCSCLYIEVYGSDAGKKLQSNVHPGERKQLDREFS